MSGVWLTVMLSKYQLTFPSRWMVRYQLPYKAMEGFAQLRLIDENETF